MYALRSLVLLFIVVLVVNVNAASVRRHDTSSTSAQPLRSLKTPDTTDTKLTTREERVNIPVPRLSKIIELASRVSPQAQGSVSSVAYGQNAPVGRFHFVATWREVHEAR
ncbi:hypothetical protein PHYSODRAFT_319508 [Phytophthora sojae]|uniref:RxLR effector protein n=1 Tax=Phytophthora sojae (strain P6497) TaxID=1094619 RepID=G5ABI7_PHYSP|nr:hypothetical protein PHYSODRAFT_319508 [Phytophthora sojae]EGZ06712.1 hypothetical protein PHYSODRAFT_319508 [Phytophthora sojae]|eukprot:XP_009537476.1 hypothetical protein PHYSODRAFT_319508 [Phytophthora sojae]